MKVFNIHDAKTNLSRLVEQAVHGESFVIAKNGKPLVQVTPIEQAVIPRVGFLEGQFSVPDDFDTMGEAEILEMFHGAPLTDIGAP
jgi:prevent-host-death family protein